MSDLSTRRRGESQELFRTVEIELVRSAYRMVHVTHSDLYLNRMPDPTAHEMKVLRSLRDGQDGEPENHEAAQIIAARRDMILELRIHHQTILIEARRASSKRSRERWRARHPEQAKKKTSRWRHARWWRGKDRSSWTRSCKTGADNVG